MQNLTAVVLAGGRGTRLAPVVDNVPKPLVAVAGRPFLSWVTSWLIREGVSDLVYSAGYLGEQIESWVATLRSLEGPRTNCRREQTPLGTAGAVLACLDICQELVLVINGDTLLLVNLRAIMSQLEAAQLDGLIVAVRVKDASRFGQLELREDGLLRSICEKKPGAGIVNGGVYLFPKATLERFLPVRPMSLELDLLPELLRTGARIGVATPEVPFLDIGVPEALAAASEFVVAHRSRIAEPAEEA